MNPLLRSVFLSVCLFGLVACPAHACDQLAAGESLWIQLTSSVSTYTARKGDVVHAVLTHDAVCGGEIVLPMGTPIDGVVRDRHKVGFGIRHETASLTLEFTSAQINGQAVPLKAQVEEVENAREVVKAGVIQGIRSSDTPQGRITSRLIHMPTLNPYSDVFLVAFKSAFPVFPEPEIYYPAGTGLRLSTATPTQIPTQPPTQLLITSEVSHSLATSQSIDAPVTDEDGHDEQLISTVNQMPVRVQTRDEANADLINLAFIGDRQQVERAFRKAGWDNTDRISRHAVLRNVYALLNHSGYARQPMATFYVDGAPQQMSWQKSLNSYDRRDHLRMWEWRPEGSQGAPLWISSSTHDTGGALSVKHRRFMHHIDANVDDERETILRELTFAGCISSVVYVPRPSAQNVMRNATGDTMRTDGEVAVVTLKTCEPNALQTPNAATVVSAYRPGNPFFRFARRQILTFRSDIYRSNILYGAYDGGRMAFTAMRRRPPIIQTASSDQPAPPNDSLSNQRYEETTSSRTRRPYSLRTVH